jgi:hypothetical protein
MCCLAAYNKNHGIVDLGNFSSFCEKQIEEFPFVHFVIKFAAIFGSRCLQSIIYFVVSYHPATVGDLMVILIFS